MRNKIGVFDAISETIKQLNECGLLLVSGKQGNPMAIGWGTIGIIWAKPVFIVLVRPSRYTFKLIEKCNEFSVNVPTENLKDQVMICGSKSGRDIDKIKECNFTLEKGHIISVPFIKECPIHYECRTIHKNKVLNEKLTNEIVKEYYPAVDFHTIYYGEIVGVYKS